MAKQTKSSATSTKAQAKCNLKKQMEEVMNKVESKKASKSAKKQITEADFKALWEVERNKTPTYRPDYDLNLSDGEYKFFKDNPEYTLEYVAWVDKYGKKKSAEKKTISPAERIIEAVNATGSIEELKQIITVFKEAVEIRKGAFSKKPIKKESKIKLQVQDESEVKSANTESATVTTKVESKGDKRVKDKFGVMFQGVPQQMTITAKVRKEMKITRYSERCFLLYTPKSVHDYLFGNKKKGVSGLLTGYVTGWDDKNEAWWLPQSKVQKVADALKIKIA